MVIINVKRCNNLSYKFIIENDVICSEKEQTYNNSLGDSIIEKCTNLLGGTYYFEIINSKAIFIFVISQIWKK